jgi:phosphohistidine phosphatase
MKTIFLLRHAKSSWSDPSLADFDRPLNERGKKAAPFMGKLMEERGFSPEIIVTSPAVRARTTASLAKEAGKLPGLLIFEPRIYEASTQGLRQVASELSDSVKSALIVGHNPGMEGFIRYLTGRVEPMPTAALAVIPLGVDKWHDISEGCGTLQHTFRPREEMK